MSGSKAYSDGGDSPRMRPSPASTARAAFAWSWAAVSCASPIDLREAVEAEPHGGREAGLRHGQPLVDGQATVEHPLRPPPPGPPRLQPRRLRDADQRLLGEPVLLAEVPALEAEAGVPVQVAAVGPIAGDRPTDPAADERAPGGRQGRHPGAPSLHVEAQEREHDVRVLRRVDVRRRPRRPPRHVLEAQPGAEVARAGDEPRELRTQVVTQQRRVAGHRGVGGIDERVPVDLVEPEPRPAPEPAVRHTVDAVTDEPHRPRRQPELAPRLPGVHQRVDDLGVDHHVLRRAGVVHAAGPAGRMRLRARGRVSSRPLDEDGERDQRLGDRPRPGIVARRAAVSGVGGDAVCEQQARVDQGVGAALAGPVEAAPLVPQAIEPFLHPIGVGEIAGVVVPHRGSRCCCDDEQPRQERRGERTRAASKRRHEKPPGARRGRDGDPRAERGRQRVLPAASGALLHVAGLPGSGAIQCRHQQHGWIADLRR